MKRSCWTTVALVSVLSVAVGAPLLAQVETPEPRRPKLPSYADTNDARAYYDFGLERLEKRPRDAADAFYWASRLAPEWAHPLYARRVAMLKGDMGRFMRYMEGHEKTLRSAEVQHIDSLELRAQFRDPFLHRGLDNELITLYLTEAAMTALRRRYSAAEVERNRSELEYWIQDYIRSETAKAWAAWRAYSFGEFGNALKYYADALKHADDSSHVYLQRGRIFYLVHQYDSAHVQLVRAVEASRQRDEDELVRVYESKAVMEYCVGVASEARGDVDGARDAYGRALVEDLAFYPAHMRLGLLALDAGDSATALSELDLAVAIQPSDAVPHLWYGKVLLVSQRNEEAVAHLEQALAIEPHYAELHYLLGVAAESMDDGARAITHYDRFLAGAARDDERRGWAAERRAALRAS